MSARPKAGSRAPRTEPFSVVVTQKLLQLRLRRGIYRFDRDGGLEKRCGACGEYWPADTEFFLLSGEDLSSYCRACNHDAAARSQLRAASNPA